MTLALTPTDVMRGDRPVFMLSAPITLQGITIPRGFLTDLVSATNWARKRLPLEKMAKAAVLHDFACNRMRHWSKWKCNRLFRRQMAEDGVPLHIRWAVWLYVSRNYFSLGLLHAPRVNWAQPFLEGGAE